MVCLSTGHLCIWGWPWGHRTRRASESKGIRGPCNAMATGCVPDRISLEESQQQSGKSFSNPPLRGSSPSFLLPPPSLPVMKQIILLSLITSSEAWYDHWQVTAWPPGKAHPVTEDLRTERLDLRKTLVCAKDACSDKCHWMSLF